MNAQLTENNYIVIPNFISSSRAKSLAEQFNTYCGDHHISDDPQVQNCSAKYDFIPFVELLVEKNAIIGEFVGESVLPTYTYARQYKKGNTLAAHVDKPQCEISLTINLECSEVWDIWIETPEGKRNEVSLSPGDAMLYLGTEGMHGRELFEGELCTQVFLHYVKSKGPNFRYYFDKDHRYRDDEVKLETITTSANSNVSESPLAEYIKVYDSIFTPEECKTILDEYKKSNEWQSAKISSKKLENKNVRNCDVMNISLPNIIEKNQSTRKKIDELIFKNTNYAAQKYISEFPKCFLKTDSGYDLLRYETGGYYTEHTDSYNEQPRTLAMSVNLNDDYEGGNMAFFDKEIQIRGGVGSVIMFPANFMYPHQIMEVTKGTRYSIVTWFL